MRARHDFEERSQRSEKLVKLVTVERVNEDEFIGPTTPAEHSLGRNRVYGGLVAAQALAAAEATVAEDRVAASLHCRFLRQGDESQRIHYHVERDMDGGSISHRRVTAKQNGTTILSFSSMHHRPGNGLAHQPAMPNVAPPEALRALFDRYDTLPFALHRFLNVPRLIEMLPVDHAMLDNLGPNPQPFRTWFRPSTAAVEDAHVRRAILAYASDTALLISATLRHGLIAYRDEVRSASLDHGLWIHDDFSADDWLLYESQSPWAGHQRGLTCGQIFARDGRLIASALQEGLLRLTSRPA